MTYWNQQLFGTQCFSGTDNEEARKNYFASHTISIQSQPNTVVLFSASFFKTHSSKHASGKPITVWECDLFEPNGMYSVLPVQFSKRIAISLTDKVNGANVLLVYPCIDF